MLHIIKHGGLYWMMQCITQHRMQRCCGTRI